jgi:ATP-dependent helicase/nuclease subunit A
VRQKELFGDYRALKDEVVEALRARAVVDLLPHCEAFVRGYEAERRSHGVADFDDLLLWSRDLLRDRVDVRHYFQRRFNALLIDEFQDTDPVQVEITAFLAGQGESTTNWREVVPAPGKLFLVGDPKQSIYRFRRADIAIYDQVKTGGLGGETLSISQNFRSLPGVIDWVNGVFDQLFIPTVGLQPPNIPLEPVDRAIPIDRPATILLHAEDETLDANGVRELESRSVAALLHQAVRVEHWPVRDRATGEIRAAEWRDIAILLPARTGLEAYEEAFAAADIPYRHEGSRDYFMRQEVRDLISILRAVDDPSDRVSLAGALRSSAFGCSDDDLVIHKAGNAPWDYRVTEVHSHSPAVADAFEALRGWYKARGRRSLPQLVREVVEETRLVEFALTLPDGPQAAANLLAIVDQARAFSAAGGGGLRAFTRWLVQSTDEESLEVDAGIAEEADDVVRILTMHGSKGLEFPIVVPANLGAISKTDKEPVPHEAEGRLHVRVGSGGRNGHYATPGYEDIWDVEKAALDAEQVRLLYVATTRARDHLIVPKIIGKRSPGRFLKLLLPLLPGHAGHEIEVDGMWLVDATQLEAPPVVEQVKKEPSDSELTAAGAERDAWVDDHAAVVREAQRELPFVVASSVERATRPLSAEASHSGDTLLVSDGPPLPVGDALHLVMEQVALPDAEDLDAVVESVCLEAGILDRREEVDAMARRCLASETVRRGIATGTWRREVPFTIGRAGGFGTGRVDAVFTDDGELMIVDFKSDDVNGDETTHEAFTLEHHGGQADIYADALGHASGRVVGGVTFVYARTGTEVRVHPGAMS